MPRLGNVCCVFDISSDLWERDRETERQRDRETERQRDRETERQRNRETERQRDRELASSWNFTRGAYYNGDQQLLRFKMHLLLSLSQSRLNFLERTARL